MADESKPDTSPNFMGVDEEETTSQPSEERHESGDQLQDLLSFRRQELAQEIRRWQTEEPDLANVFNSFIGEKARFKYNPQIETLQDEVTQLRRELRRREIASLPEEELTRLYNSSVEFRHEYADLVDADPRQVDMMMQYRAVKRQADYTINSAIDDGLPEEEAERLQREVTEGKFDADEGGRLLTPQESLTLLERATRQALVNSIRNSRSSSETRNLDSASQPKKESNPQGNQNLQRMQTDIGSQGKLQVRTGNRSLAEYRQSLENNKPPTGEEIDRIVRQEFNL